MKDTRASRGARDFDFVVGTWDVANRRLTQRLVGSTEWEEFPGTSECRSILSRSGNVQEIELPTKGFSGAALRLFDPHREEWSIYWASSRTGLLEALSWVGSPEAGATSTAMTPTTARRSAST